MFGFNGIETVGESEYHEKVLATTSFVLSEGTHQVALAELHSKV